VKRWIGFSLALGLVASGLWLSVGLEMPHLLLFGAGLTGLVGIAAETFLDRANNAELRTHRQGFILWAAPGLLVVAGLWLVDLLPGGYLPMVCGGGAAIAALLLLGLSTGLSPEGRFYRMGRFLANLVLYLVVFLLFALIYQTKERSLFTATSIGLVSFVAALEILRPSQGSQVAGVRLPAVVALVVAEMTWALNYWPAGGLMGGALLLLCFYLFSGLFLAVQEGGLDRRIVAEYGIVGVLGIVAISWAMP